MAGEGLPGTASPNRACAYPFVLPDCDRMMVDIIPGPLFLSWKIAYVTFGLFMTLVAIYQTVRVMDRGNRLQKAVFPFLFIASGSFIIRGVDPNGYEGKFPYLVSTLADALCVCCLYSVSYTIGVVWAGLLRSFGSHQVHTSFCGRLAVTGSIVLTWITVLSGRIFLAVDPTSPNEPLIVGVISCVLFVLGSVSFIYLIYVGVALDKKLQESGRMVGDHKITLLPEEEGQVGRMEGCGQGGPSGGSSSCCGWWKRASKVIRMCVCFGVVAVVTSLYLLYVIYLSLHKGERVNDWYNYNECIALEKSSSCSASYMFDAFGICEMLVSVVLTWSFWRVPSRQQTAEVGPQRKPSTVKDLTPSSLGLQVEDSLRSTFSSVFSRNSSALESGSGQKEARSSQLEEGAGRGRRSRLSSEEDDEGEEEGSFRDDDDDESYGLHTYRQISVLPRPPLAAQRSPTTTRHFSDTGSSYYLDGAILEDSNSSSTSSGLTATTNGPPTSKYRRPLQPTLKVIL